MGISARRKARSLEFFGFAKSWARGAVAARLLCKQEAVGSKTPSEFSGVFAARGAGKSHRVHNTSRGHIPLRVCTQKPQVSATAQNAGFWCMPLPPVEAMDAQYIVKMLHYAVVRLTSCGGFVVRFPSKSPFPGASGIGRR